MMLGGLPHNIWFTVMGVATTAPAAGGGAGHVSRSAATGRIFMALGALVVLVFVVIVVALVARKMFHRSSEESFTETGFSLSDLRELHRQGRLSDEEFAAAKALVVQRGRRVLDEDDGTENKRRGGGKAEDEGSDDASSI